MYDLKNTKMIIYKITNTVNDKCYIGQTINTFNKRYEAKGEGIERVYNYLKGLTKHRKKSYNRHLLYAIEKYGFESFSIEILETCKTIAKLNSREIYYIKLYKSSNPAYGYNVQQGGENYKQSAKLKKQRAKEREKQKLEEMSSLYEELGLKEVKIKINKDVYKKLTGREKKLILFLHVFNTYGFNNLSLTLIKKIDGYTGKVCLDFLEKCKKKKLIDFNIIENTFTFKLMVNIESDEGELLILKTKYIVDLNTSLDLHSKFYEKGGKLFVCQSCNRYAIAKSKTCPNKYCEPCAKKVKNEQIKSYKKKVA